MGDFTKLFAYAVGIVILLLIIGGVIYLIIDDIGNRNRRDDTDIERDRREWGKISSLVKRCAKVNMSMNKLGDLLGPSTCKNETHICEISALEKEYFDVFNCKKTYWMES